MIDLNRMPTYTLPLSEKGQTHRTWYSFFSGLATGKPTGIVSAVMLNGSPFTFTAPSGGTLIVNGGSTTQIQYSRDGAAYFVTGQTAGMFPVSLGDKIEITYSMAPPTVNFVPR
jgi:hypothetical protein